MTNIKPNKFHRGSIFYLIEQARDYAKRNEYDLNVMPGSVGYQAALDDIESALNDGRLDTRPITL